MSKQAKKPLKAESKARQIWDEIVKRDELFTADDVAEALKMEAATVRHYFTYWKTKGAMEADGKVEEVGKLGRPRLLWKLTTKSFVSVWR